jgi:carboxyl-terminal processing protease
LDDNLFKPELSMRVKNSTILLAGCLIVVLMAGAFSSGLIVGLAMPRGDVLASLEQSLSTIMPTSPVSTPQVTLITPGVTPLPSTASGNSATPEELKQLFQPFWQSWDLVHQQYVNQPVDDTKLMQGAIKGMLDSLGDPHTTYMDPSSFSQQMAALNTGTQYEGIGAWVDATGSYLKIISPMPDSPAQKAGLKPGDIILAVDGQDMTGVPGDQVLQKVLGPAGTNVTLTIQRGEQKPFDVVIARAQITTPQVEWHMEKNNIAYVHLFIYGELTATELNQALQDMLPKKPAGLILDLRYNGGGYLDSAIDVLSEFVPAGQVVMYEEHGNGQKITYKAKGGGIATQIPIVVLINEGTASASEITAGALQDLGRAKLVGVKSYGKGSVQAVTALQDGQGGVRITIARWLTPNGRQINGVGLTPDYDVPITDSDLTAGIDPQLDKAIALLSAP